MSDQAMDPAALLAGIREETRFELRLLHERVNTLLAAEAFLTIAYTATMNSHGAWAAVVAPVLAVLGLLLAGLAGPGIWTTADLVMRWTNQVGDLIERYPQARFPSSTGPEDRRSRESGQRRSLLLFRFAAPLFLCVWIILLVCAIVLHT